MGFHKLNIQYIALDVTGWSKDESAKKEKKAIDSKGMFTLTKITITISILAFTTTDDNVLFIISKCCSYVIWQFKCSSSLKMG